MRGLLKLSLLLIFTIATAFPLSVDVNQPITAYPNGWDHALRTDVHISYTATVSAPPSYVIRGDPNNLGDGDIICPNTPLQVSADITGSYALTNWYATFTAPAGECPEGDSIAPSPNQLEFSLSLYNQWSPLGEPVGALISSSHSQPLHVETDNCGTVVVEAPDRGVAGPNVYIDIGGNRREFQEGPSFTHSQTVGQGNVDVSIGGVIEGLVIALLYDKTSTYTAFYTTEGGSGPISLGEDTITLIATSPSVDATVESVNPPTISTLPVDVEVVVTNTGNVPLIFDGVSATPPLQAQPLEGFNTVIDVGESATLLFRLSGQLPNDPSVVLEGRADREYCGESPTLSLPLPLSRGKDAEAVLVVNGVEYRGTANSVMVAQGSTVSVTFRMCGQGSFTAHSVRRIEGSEGVIFEDESDESFSGLCRDITTTSFSCTNGPYIVTHRLFLNGDSNGANDFAVVTVTCEQNTQCTPEPAQKTLFPGSSFLSTIWCGPVLCDSVDATTPFEWISIEPYNAFTLSILSSPQSPPGSSGYVEVSASREGLSYSCRIDLSIAMAECIDFI